MRWMRRAARGRDVGLIYAAVVAVFTLLLTIVPASTANEILLTSSTNLVNLRSHPPRVLALSAFVQPSVLQLWVLAPLVWA